jgi:O-acetyl-ADP-ribose deacetylase (regulator of RNase III)/uncharacterized protein YwgA
MIKVLIGNLFDSRAQTLVNTVNCVGVMGKGIALEFKKRFPEMFRDYEQRCKRGEVILGRPYLYKPRGFFSDNSNQSSFLPDEECQTASDKWILNFPTKDHWRSLAHLDSIVEGVKFLLDHYKEWGVKSLAMPPLGCGEGQLEWRVVGPTLYRYLNKMDIPVEFYAPYNTPHDELQIQFLSQTKDASIEMPDPKWIPAGWIVIVEIIKRLEDEPHYRGPVGKTIFQKIAFAATKAGVDTQLKFEKGSYGPYSSELQKDVLSRLINNGLVEEEYLGKMHAIKPGPTFLDARKAYAKKLEEWASIIDKVVDLFMRLNTEQAEIIATVIFAADQLKFTPGKKPTEQAVLDYVMQWKQKKTPPLSVQKVAEAIRNLAVLEWIEVEASPSYLGFSELL